MLNSDPSSPDSALATGAVACEIDRFLAAILICPRHRTPLRPHTLELTCQSGCRFPVVEGVPVMLLEEEQQTIGIANASLKAANERTGGPLYLDTIGLSDEEKQGIRRDSESEGPVDAVISYLVGATSGYGYEKLIGKLAAYPIPRIPVEEGRGRALLDIGCNWGRWSVSAARKGWRVVGLDPSLGAIMAAKRAFPDSNVSFVCGDARHLPFKHSSFDTIYSYSVLQHFSHADVRQTLKEVDRVLARGGRSVIQMAHSGGLRSKYNQIRPDYLQSGPFRVRYWSLDELRHTFGEAIGSVRIRAEAFGGLGLLLEDLPIVSNKAKALIIASELAKRLTAIFPPAMQLADSVFVTASKV